MSDSYFQPALMVQQKLTKWALYWFGYLQCIALLLPNHYLPWIGFHQEWLSVIAITPLLAWSLWVQYTDPPPRMPWLVPAALLGALLAVLQWFAGRLAFHGDAIMAAAYWLLFAACVLAGRQVAAHDKLLFGGAGAVPFWLAWVFAGILSLAMALHQWLDLSYFSLFIIDFPAGGRPFANMAQPNHLATLFLLSLTGALYLYEVQRINSLTACALVLCFCQGLAMTQSRSVFLGLAFAGIAFYTIRFRHRLRTPAWGFGVLILAYLAFSMAWPWMNEALLLSNAAQSSLDRMEPGIRVILWASALDAIALKPWMGWGFGQIGMAQQATALAYPATHTFFSSAHNIFLDLVLWMGIPGSLVFFVFFGMHLRDCRISAINPKASWAAWTGLACISGHAMVEFPLFYAYFLVPAGFLLGSLSAGATHGVSIRIGKSFHRIGILLLSLSGLLFLPKLTMEYFSWESDWRNVGFELSRFSVSEPAYEPRLTLLDQIATMHKVGRQKPTSNMSDDELEMFKRNADRYPSSIALLRYAYAAALNGKAEVAQHSLKLLCSMHTKAMCDHAHQQWKQDSASKWPILQSVAFPEPGEYNGN
ncbi:PglL family O-oligosaccharyltransferase [Verminephrobacter aporrectodeae]|uniref:PglL family O-oligosaccharyltransferase n=1 Tax=Verminephrobacter aporrectodeae TaxID=1110389 RepID=UPI002237F349|nr:O-antigen ligase family protein [Verminephrobacter aporrectodeae]